MELLSLRREHSPRHLLNLDKDIYVLLDRIPGESKEQNYLSTPWRIAGYLFLVQAKANYMVLQLYADPQGRPKEDKQLLGRAWK